MVTSLPIRQEIYQVVALIPSGKVATYGQIARLSGFPRHARMVGYALNALPAHSPLPWHRVINAQGKISLRSSDQQGEHSQKLKLQQEGVVFDGDRVKLAVYQWQA